MLAEDGVLRLKFITPFLLSGVTVELPLNEELDVSILLQLLVVQRGS